MLVSSKAMLADAYKSGYAIGAFNTSNLETSKAIIEAAQELRSPVIIQTSPKAIEYAGLENIASIIKLLAIRATIPVALNLDHGTDVALAHRCIDAGYTSIMIDASARPFEENAAMVRQVVKMAWWKGVQVEAELGRLQGVEDHVNVSADQAFYTDPKQAAQFVKLSGCHSLAVAIGTSHGAFKYSKDSTLRIDILRDINSACNIPLVLHGASAVHQDHVKIANKYGGKIKGAKGVDEKLIAAAVQNGISKINTDTDLRLAFTSALRMHLAKEPADFDPRAIMIPAFEEVKTTVMHRIKAFGSEGMADKFKN